MLKSDSLAKLAPALVKAQKNMGAALKDAKNPFFKSKFADLNAVIDASIPVLNEQGIAVLQTPQVIDGKPVIQTILLHESGEYLASNTEVTASKSNDPQAAGSAISYARRYGLQATVTLKAEDDDGESAMGRKGDKSALNVPLPVSSAPVSTSSTTVTIPATAGLTDKPKTDWNALKKSKPQKIETKPEGDLY